MKESKKLMYEWLQMIVWSHSHCDEDSRIRVKGAKGAFLVSAEVPVRLFRNFIAELDPAELEIIRKPKDKS